MIGASTRSDKSMPTTGFTALAQECTASRIWAGVHFRTSSDAGQRLGEAIADHVVGNLLRPLRENK
jgi:hypothetical protein